MKMMELYHHGIKGQKWGIRRYQNPDGTLTPAGRAKLQKKDEKWASKNYDKIYKKAYRASEKEINKRIKTDLRPQYKTNGKLTAEYINKLNNAMAEVMTTKVTDLSAPSGRAVKFVAKRGEVGVHMALADANYDMSQLKRGVWNDGRVAYKSKQLNVSGR